MFYLFNLKLFLFVFLGVFGDEKDEMKTLSGMEGDDLNLNTETEIQTDDEIIVRFGTAFRKSHPYVTIARFSKQGDEFKSEERGFKGRLQLDLTGTLTITITKFETTDCGDYYVQITNKKKKSFKSFTFIVVPRGEYLKSLTTFSLAIRQRESICDRMSFYLCLLRSEQWLTAHMVKLMKMNIHLHILRNATFQNQ